jgi:hypothetical protein
MKRRQRPEQKSPRPIKIRARLTQLPVRPFYFPVRYPGNCLEICRNFSPLRGQNRRVETNRSGFSQKLPVDQGSAVEAPRPQAINPSFLKPGLP